MLALVLLINRSGAMVLPFMSVYLKDELGFSASDVGIILSLFGLGSLAGSYLGGWLSDRLGTFWVQFWSLSLAGVCFFILSYLRDFYSLAIGVFCITLISESFRPANTAAVAKHAKPENLTRAYSLNRMAINLGFALGPALGGFLAHIGYEWLFYVNAFSAIASAFVFAAYFYAHRDKAAAPKPDKGMNPEPARSPFRDVKFLGIAFLTICYAVAFFQLLFTLPVYYREYYLLSEKTIGGILAFNGILVFALEMPLVYVAGKYISLSRIVALGCLLLCLSYALLSFGEGMSYILGAMALLSISEILVMPFLTSFSANRGGEASRGSYLGVYAMMYSLAFIVAPPLAFYLIELQGYTYLWICLAVLSGIIAPAYLYGIGKTKTKSKSPEAIEISA